MTTNIGSLAVSLSLNASSFNGSMAQVDRNLRAMGSELKATKALGSEYGKSLDGLRSKKDVLSRTLETANIKLTETRKKYDELKNSGTANEAQLERQAKKVNDAQAQFNNLKTELDDVERALKIQSSSWTQLSQKLEPIGAKLKTVGDGMVSVGKDLSMKVTAPLVAMGTAAFKTAVDFESAFAGVRKTVNATEEEFEVLSTGIRDMAKEMPASATEIARVAEAAGQLGIKKENILGFTRTMTDLGVATNMASDEAATALARLANITQMNQADFDKLGSSIVALGNNFATTESEITEMALRLAGAGAQVGMSEADILALSAALSSVGIEAEMGGSAMSRVMVEMQVATSTGFTKVQELSKKTGLSIRDLQMMASHSGKAFGNMAEDLGMTKKELTALVNAGVDLEGFSKVAGMTGEQFKKAFEQDAIGALGAFINGLANAEASGDTAINMLQEMGISEIRLRDSLLRAGGASELFANAVDLSNKAWDENNALTKEAEERYKTTASQLSIMWNQVKDLGITIGNILIPIVMDLVEKITPMIQKFAEMDTGTQKVILGLAGIAAAIGPVLIIGGTLVSSLGAIVTAVGTVAGAIAVVTTGAAAATPAVGALAGVFTVLTGPIGITVAAITGVGIALVSLYKHNETFRTKVNEIWSSIKNRFEIALNSIKNVVQSVMTNVMGFFGDILSKIKVFWKENGDSIMQVVNFFMTYIVESIKTQMAFIKGIFQMVWPIIEGVIKIAWAGIKVTIKNAIDIILGMLQFWIKIFTGDWKGAFNTIKETAVNIMNNIVSTFKNINLLEIGKNIVDGFLKGFSSMKGAVVEAAKNIAGALPEWIKKVLDIRSPSRVTEKLGEHTGEGFAKGIKKKKKTAEQVAKEVAAAAKKGFKEEMDKAEYKFKMEQINSAQYIKELEKIRKEYAKYPAMVREVNLEIKKVQDNAAKHREKLRKEEEKAQEEARKKQLEAEKKKAEAERKQFEDRKKLIDDRKNYNDLSLMQELEAWKTLMNKYKKGTEERAEAEREVYRIKNEINQKLITLNEEYTNKVADANKRLIDGERALNAEYERAVADRTKTLTGFVGIFDKVKEASDISGQGLIDNLKGQVSTFAEWSKNIQTLANRGIDQGLLEELRQMGPSAAGEIAALNTLTDAQLGEYSGLWKTKNQLAREQALKELEGLKKDTSSKIEELRKQTAIDLETYKNEWIDKVKEIRFGTTDAFVDLNTSMTKIGKDSISGLINGMLSMHGPLMEEAQKLANTIAKTIKDALKIKSPSRIMMKIGGFVGEGLAVGMQETVSQVTGKARLLARAAIPMIPDINVPNFSNVNFAGVGNNSSGNPSSNSFSFNIQPAPIIIDGVNVGTVDFDLVEDGLNSRFTSKMRVNGVRK
jgi:phage-related protein